MGICTHMWTPEVDIEHLLQLLFALYIDADPPSLNLGLEVSKSVLGIPCLLPSCWDYRWASLRICTVIPMLTKQALYLLSQVPRSFDPLCLAF